MSNVDNIINPLLWGEISEADVARVGATTPKYTIGEIVDLETWIGGKHDFKVEDVKVTYHNRLSRYVWGYKLYKEGESTGFSFQYIPEGYLRKKGKEEE